MNVINFVDKAPISGVKVIDGGYLVATSRVARVGIQDYLACEVGLEGNHIVKVYRPPEEVFSDKSLATFSHAPVTIGHPSVLVTADNWADLAVGEVSTVIKNDDGWVAIPLILKDASAIKIVNDGTKEISMGYTSIIDHTAGVLPNGDKYDMIQRDIKINHLAIVKSGRAGNEARIGDSSKNWGISPQQRENKIMEFETIVMGDSAVKVAVSDASTIKAFVASIVADAKAKVAVAKGEVEEKEEEIGGLKADLKKSKDAALTDADIEKRVASKMALTSDAAKIAPDLKVEGLSDAAIVKGAVAVAFGDEMVVDASDAELSGMFKAALKDHKKAPAKVDDSFRKVLADGATVVVADHGWGNALKSVGALKA